MKFSKCPSNQRKIRARAASHCSDGGEQLDNTKVILGARPAQNCAIAMTAQLLFTAPLYWAANFNNLMAAKSVTSPPTRLVA